MCDHSRQSWARPQKCCLPWLGSPVFVCLVPGVSRLGQSAPHPRHGLNEGTLVVHSAVTSRRPLGLVLQALTPAVERDPVCSLCALTAQHLQGQSGGPARCSGCFHFSESFLTHPRKKVLVTPCVSCFVVCEADQKLFGERAQTGLLRALPAGGRMRLTNLRGWATQRGRGRDGVRSVFHVPPLNPLSHPGLRGPPTPTPSSEAGPAAWAGRAGWRLLPRSCF